MTEVDNSATFTIQTYPITSFIQDNEYYRWLELINGSYTLVDRKYYDHLVSVSKWSFDSKSYPQSTSHIYNDRKILLSRYIMYIEDNDIDLYEVDHINHNLLDNRISNLRMCNRQENCRNKLKRKGTSSNYIGVSWSKQNNKWRASIKHNQKQKNLGYFDNEIEAANAYNQALSELPIAEEFKQYNIIH